MKQRTLRILIITGATQTAAANITITATTAVPNSCTISDLDITVGCGVIPRRRQRASSWVPLNRPTTIPTAAQTVTITRLLSGAPQIQNRQCTNHHTGQRHFTSLRLDFPGQGAPFRTAALQTEGSDRRSAHANRLFTAHTTFTITSRLIVLALLFVRLARPLGLLPQRSLPPIDTSSNSPVLNILGHYIGRHCLQPQPRSAALP